MLLNFAVFLEVKIAEKSVLKKEKSGKIMIINEDRQIQQMDPKFQQQRVQWILTFRILDSSL